MVGIRKGIRISSREKDMVERRERKKRKVVDNLETPLVPEEENRRVKRDAATKWKKGVQPGEDVVAKVEMFRRGANYTAMWLPKMEWIKHRDENGEIESCDCEWGLFRDRNVTLRKAIKMNHGAADITMRMEKSR